MSVVQTLVSPGQNYAATEWFDFFNTGSTHWVAFSTTDVLVQVTGTASSATVVIERSPINPNGPYPLSYGPMTPLIGSAIVLANVSAGIPAQTYNESGCGWWRATVSALTGTCRVALTGKVP